MRLILWNVWVEYIFQKISEWLQGKNWSHLQGCGVQCWKETGGLGIASFWKWNFEPDFWGAVILNSLSPLSRHSAFCTVWSQDLYLYYTLSLPPSQISCSLNYHFSLLNFQLLPLSWLFLLSVWTCFNQLHLKIILSWQKRTKLSKLCDRYMESHYDILSSFLYTGKFL